MRILIVHNSLNDSTSMSGVLKHYLLMARAWQAMGHRVDFLVARAGFPQIQSVTPSSALVCSDRIFDATNYLASTWRYFPAFGWRMATCHWTRLPCDYEVVYASNFLIFEVYPAWVLARRCGARLVVKIQHLLHSQTERRGLFDRLFLVSERWSVRLANRCADLMMCLSEPVSRDYDDVVHAVGLPKRPMHTVGCGLDYSEIDAVPTQEKRYDIVFLGRMHEQKGVFDLSRVWSILLEQRPEASLLVIGEGPQRAAMMEQFRECGLEKRVTFTGGVGEGRKNTLLKQSRVGLSLSFEEGWGLSVTEFLAAGLPVVAYDLPVLREVFGRHVDFVPMRDCEAMASLLVEWISDPERRSLQGRLNASFVRAFDYRTVADQEMKLIASCHSEGQRVKV